MLRTIRSIAFVVVLLLGAAGYMLASPSEDTDGGSSKDAPLSAGTFAGLELRSIGPALMSGRICDFAVHPDNRGYYYAAVCSGNVWKTTNAGTTWKPVFDKYGSYSIGCIVMDPQNPNVLWVGTGENNSQRSVSFGDGVYRTRDGGKSWENLGLKDSEHIGRIVIDPRDSDVVYVAAQGPLWRSGGDRGLYKTIDGGVTWARILHVSDDTGVNEVYIDPRDPDVLYASAYQRRRHVWTLIDGGPESAIYKSTDAGATWRKLTNGIPDVDKGRIGLCVSPAKPDVVYAIVEAADDKGGFFRSVDRGESWEKRDGYMTTSPQYYNEIICDPVKVDRVYTMDTVMHVTEDGGKTFSGMPRDHRHVDDHALWIDPKDNNYLLVGCDGGAYESFDRGANWNFKANLPVTQFYRVSVDNSAPFYNVYGGTQDNCSQGGPSRTTSRAGITNEDWFITVGGDGYETQVDPEDPNIVYSQWQYGGLVRHDRRSGETLDIKPREAPGEDPYRWNWDTPLILSPHSHTRLYIAAQKLFRSDDRGNSWTAISEDLTRGLDRNTLKVMGKVQSVDAIAKNWNTSVFGNSVALTESPLVEGLIYVGTDDGVVGVTEDSGETWRRIELFPGVPDMAYVSGLTASQHDPNTVFVTFDNHKHGDFLPYVLKSTNRGQTWTSMAGDLPERDIVYTLREDHIKPELLFVGTEFGAYFTLDGGQKWIKLKGGMPTISVRDLDIQKRENDLVLGTFGRGFYILDDYTPLRHVSQEALESDSILFPVKTALRYIETSRLGGSSGRGSQGASFYGAENPPYGAVFTYYLKEKLTSRRDRRKETEKKAIKAGNNPRIPTIDELRLEDEEKEPSILLLVRDDTGEIIRRINGSRDKGIHRESWNLRYPASTPTVLEQPADRPPWWRPPSGPLALPGTFNVTLAKEVDGEITELSEPVSFDVIPLELATFAAADRAELLAFQNKVARLQRAVRGTVKVVDETQNRISHIRKAFVDTPGADRAWLVEIDGLQQELNKMRTRLTGDRTLRKREEASPPSISERVRHAIQWNVTSPPTQTQQDAYQHAGTEFAALLAELRTLIQLDLANVEARLEEVGAPWTPGRIPNWEIE